MNTTDEIRFARLSDADGAISPDQFEVARGAPLPEVADGQVLVQTLRIGLNAGMANRLGGETAMDLGSVPTSDCLVRVETSAAPGLAAGDLALRPWAGWRTRDVVAAADLHRLKAGTEVLPHEDHMSVLGHVGFTAWTGLTVAGGGVTPGQTVVVSGASGGVGTCAAQFAKAWGARVVASSGSGDKRRFLTETLGLDAAIDYHDEDLAGALRTAAPDGIDLFYDNVGGELLDAALGALAYGGRVVVCGATSTYNRSDQSGLANYRRIIYGENTIRGFAVTNHEHRRTQFEDEIAPLVHAGAVRGVYTVVDGFDSIPDAFAGHISGTGVGRTIIRVAD